MDLQAEFRMLDIGKYLGHFIGNYRNTYFMLGKRNSQIIYSYQLLPGTDEAIYCRIGDITINMKATKNLKMLDLVMNNVAVELSDDECEQYEELMQTLVLDLPDKKITAVNVAVLSGKFL